MLKFAVLCFVVIMASTLAEQCGDQVCGAGSCCAEYPEMHCKRVGQLYDICVDADATKDSGNHLFFCPFVDEGRCTAIMNNLVHVKRKLTGRSE
uniref:U20-Hexatoxin-Hf1r_1 n=1 Tax=Hadronyche formidabilis TaxID=426499 RepID=A0A4Q8K8R3_HADFO